MATNAERPTVIPGEAEVLVRRKVSLPVTLGRLAKKKPLGAVSLGVILLVIFAAVFADIVAPYQFFEQSVDDRLQGSSVRHLLGTDSLGRDIFTRIIYGARISLFVGIMATLFGVAHGSFWGLVSGYFGGKFDLYVQRVMDIILAIPTLIMALVIVATFGASLWNVIGAIAFTITPRANRLMRGTVISTKENQYIDAARAIGANNRRIMGLHILPNVLAPIFVLVSLDLGSVIIQEASLSFLGLGVPPPTPTWGGMLSGEGRFYMIRAPWIAVWPGVAITMTVMAFNLLGDALRDILDPRLKQ